MCYENERTVRGAYRRGRGWSGGRGHAGCECGCCECCCCDCCHCGCEDLPFGFRRRFTSRAERIEELDRYLSQLEAEAAGAREHIADLKAASGGGGKQPCNG